MKINVSHVAELANLTLSEEEKNSLERQLEETLKYVERLNEIDTSEVKGTSGVNNLVNIWREDEVKPSLSQKEALMNAKRTYNGFFVVDAVFGEGAS